MIKGLGWTSIDNINRMVIEVPIALTIQREDLMVPLIEDYMFMSLADRWVVLNEKDVDNTIYYSVGHVPLNHSPLVDVRDKIGYVKSIDIKNKTAEIILSNYKAAELVSSGFMDSNKVLDFKFHVFRDKKNNEPMLLGVYYAYLKDREDDKND